MAVGKISIIINSDDFIKGMSTSSNLSNGGFSPETDCVNLIANPGVLYAPNGLTTMGTLGGRVIAHCFDNNQDTTHPGYDKWLITSDGGLYYISGLTLTAYGSNPLFSVNLYATGFTDILPFETSGSPAYPDFYVTQKNGVTKFVWDYAGNNLRSIEEDWWTGSGGDKQGNAALSSNPHPMVVFNKTLFIADGNKLHTWDGTTSVVGVLTLASYEVITSLLIDPGTGRLLVGVSSRGLIASPVDYSISISSPSYIGLYDGITPTQFLRKVPVDGTVTAMRNVGGTVYLAYDNKIGSWNGNGITFIRNLYFQQNGTNYNIYKHKMTNLDNMLYVVDNSANQNPWLSVANSQILAYGEVQAGTKAFFPIVSSSIDTITDFVANLGNTGIIFSHLHTDLTTFKLYYLPILAHSTVISTGDDSPLWVSLRYSLQRPSIINQVRIFYEDPVVADGTVIGNMAVISDNRISDYAQDISNPSGGASTAWIDIFPDVQTTDFQLKYEWDETATNHGIQKIMVFYTPYE